MLRVRIHMVDLKLRVEEKLVHKRQQTNVFEKIALPHCEKEKKDLINSNKAAEMFEMALANFQFKCFNGDCN